MAAEVGKSVTVRRRIFKQNHRVSYTVRLRLRIARHRRRGKCRNHRRWQPPPVLFRPVAGRLE